MQTHVMYALDYVIVCIFMSSKTYSADWLVWDLCSVLEANSPELAKKTIEVMHRADIRGRQIIVREASNKFVRCKVHVALLN